MLWYMHTVINTHIIILQRLSNTVFYQIYFVLLGILGKTKCSFFYNKKALYLTLFGWYCLDFPYLTIEHHDALIGTKTRIMRINQQNVLHKYGVIYKRYTLPHS